QRTGAPGLHERRGVEPVDEGRSRRRDMDETVVLQVLLQQGAVVDVAAARDVEARGEAATLEPLVQLALDLGRGAQVAPDAPRLPRREDLVAEPGESHDLAATGPVLLRVVG